MKSLGKIAIVWWYDAYTGERDNVQDEPKDKGVPSISVGHLVARNKNGVRLAVIKHFDMQGGPVLRTEHFIPAGMIKKVQLRSIK